MFLDPQKRIEKHKDRLPHWQQPGSTIFLTWRLADSLPTKVIEAITRRRAEWLTRHPKPWTPSVAAEYQRAFILSLEDKLDEHHGSCLLREQGNRTIVTDAFHYFDGNRYDLDSYVVMPNHVHLLLSLREDHRIEDIVGSIKSFTSKSINKRLGKSGTLWQRSYWDRLIRSEHHLKWTLRYISQNPKNLPPNHYSLWAKERGPLA